MNDLELKILKILSVQSPGYDAYPNASCFIAEGVTDPVETDHALVNLCNEGYAVRFLHEVLLRTSDEVMASLTDEELDDLQEIPKDETVLIPGGYTITDEGRNYISNLE